MIIGGMSTPKTVTPFSAGVCRLQDWGLMRAQGTEAVKFLHGQLTQDVEHLVPGKACLAGYCSAKGRLLATMVIWPGEADELLLACSADLLPATLKRLSMFVMRAKCKLSDASAERPLWGLAGDGVAAALDQPPLAVWGRVSLAPGQDLVRLPDALVADVLVPRYLLAAEKAPSLPVMDAEQWRWLEVHSGVVRIVSATSEQFVPQMVNLELVGGVNFQKGCYPGQEVVARSQYRGTTKRRAYVLVGQPPLAIGQELFSSDDPSQPAGLVAMLGLGPDGTVAALAEMKIAAMRGGGSLHVGHAQGALLEAGSLPYAVAADE